MFTGTKKGLILSVVAVSSIVVRAEPDAGSQAMAAVEEYVTNVHSLGMYDYSKVKKQGANAVPYLIPHLEDSDPVIREDVAILLGAIADRRANMPLANALKDSDSNVRRRAIVALYKINHSRQFEEQALLVPFLAEHARRWEENSHLAIFLMDEIAGEKCVQEIRRIRQEGAALMEKYAAVKATVPKAIDDACVQALARMGDPDARKMIADMLKNGDPKVRVHGIGMAQYVGQDMVTDLKPLLEDKTDAVDVSPSMSGTHFIRVCDAAATVLRQIHRPNLKASNTVRYSDEQLKEISRTGALGNE